MSLYHRNLSAFNRALERRESREHPDYSDPGTGNVVECECNRSPTAEEIQADQCSECSKPVLGKKETA